MLLEVSSSSDAKSIPDTPEEDVMVSTLAGEGKRGIANGPASWRGFIILSV